MGSRYGGLKQIDPVGGYGQLILDYSLYDAKRAGFETVVFVIQRSIEDDFKKAIGIRFANTFEIRYAYQELTDLPEGYVVPEGRSKPWGTAHAILAARNVVDGPFAVINAETIMVLMYSEKYTTICQNLPMVKLWSSLW